MQRRNFIGDSLGLIGLLGAGAVVNRDALPASTKELFKIDPEAPKCGDIIQGFISLGTDPELLEASEYFCDNSKLRTTENDLKFGRVIHLYVTKAVSIHPTAFPNWPLSN